MPLIREEQIDLRRQRAKTEQFAVSRVGKKKLFGDYRVHNPATEKSYTVTIRGFDVGDNSCTCPDYKANTLGTCKHIEAVLEEIRPEVPAHVRKRKAVVVRPELHLHYGEQLQLALHLPPRHSDQLGQLAKQYFDAKGIWAAGDRFEEFLTAVERGAAPEQITFATEALDFIDQSVDHRRLQQTESEWLQAIERGERPEVVKDLLRIPLYDYQLRGAIFAACRGRAILGDDMGLGKTLQAIAAAELLVRLRGIAKVLVVAPASVKHQWANEIRKFSSRSVQVVDGERPERIELYRRDTFFRLVNFEQVTRDLDELNATQPDYVVIDEAQRIKNWESKTSRAVKKLQSRYALILTGTPLENKLEELYSIVQFIDDRRLGPAFQFLHDHRVLDSKRNLTGYRNLDAIRQKLEPIFLRRTRTEVLEQLPERVDSTISVAMLAEQRGPYEEQKSALGRLLGKPVLSDLDRKRILACLANLRMLCNSTWLYDKTTHVSPKLDEFAELANELGNHKAVVFSQWEQMLHETAAVLNRLGVGYAMLHGRLPAAERKDPIDRFLNDEDCRFFLSTDAGGTGLNLQAADTVIHLEVPWNPAVLEQRIARVHRLGQKQPVRVLQLITRDSIEERVLEVIEQKRSLFSGLFAGDSDEIDFTSPGQSAFLETVRSVLDVPSESKAADAPADKLAKAGVELLEALAELLPGRHLDPQLAQRGRAALEGLTKALRAD